MNKTVDDYLNLPYTRELIPEPEGGWFVRIKELPGCMSQGETPAEALEMIADALRGWLETALDLGTPIPEPRLENEFSGKFVVRLTKSLHREISETAESEGVSLNQWVTAALAEAAGKASAGKPAAGLFSPTGPPLPNPDLPTARRLPGHNRRRRQVAARADGVDQHRDHQKLPPEK